MQISRVEKMLLKLYPHPVLLLGAPGVGKSETVRSVGQTLARSQGLEFCEFNESDDAPPGRYFFFVDLRLSEVEPTDLVGFPVVANDYVQYRPLRWAVLLSRNPGILFLDELTNVQRDDVLSSAYKLVLERKVGFTRLHPLTWVVAAGNTAEHSSIARKLPVPLVNRLVVINFPAPTLEEWVEYMNTHCPEWDRRVGAYLRRFPSDFLRIPEEAETLENFATPRTWTKLASITKRLDDDEVEDVAQGLLGTEIGSKFSVFIRTKVPEVEELIVDPAKFAKLDVDGRYIAVVMLAEWSMRNDVNRCLGLLKQILQCERELLMLYYTLLPRNFKDKVLSVLMREREFLHYFREVAKTVAGVR